MEQSTMKISDANKIRFLNLFKGREDYFAFQGTNYYRPVNLRFSEYHLERHLNGFATFGVYVLTKDSHCNFICLDIDIPKDKLTDVDFKDSKAKFDYLKKQLLELVDIFKKNLRIKEDFLLFEDTGGRGYHIWIFFEEPIKGEDALRIYKIIKNYTDIDFEFFPKQPSINKKRKFGNLIKLPLGTHQSYEAKSNFFKIVASTMVLPNTWQENFEYLYSLKKITMDNLDELLREHEELLKKETIEKFYTDDIVSVDRIYYKNEIDFLLQKCTAINELNIKARNGIELQYKEMFHFTNVLLSVKDIENFLYDSIQQSYGTKFSIDYAKAEIENIKQLHPTSCSKLIEQGICRGYCNEAIKKQNLDQMRPNSNPLSFWLTPIKRKVSIKNDEIINKISSLKNIKNAYWKLKNVARQNKLERLAC